MFNRNYGFFDYKYNIEGYCGQDYDGPARTIYMVFTLVSIVVLLFLLRKAKKERVDTFLKILAVVMVVLEASKVIWESYYDITTGRGFNAGGILPLDVCSIFMYSLLLGAFGIGKIRRFGLGWMSTMGVVGGLSNVFFIQGLKWYPFFTFGAFYSMIWHYMMVFTGLFVVVTDFFRPSFSDIGRSFALHGLVSAIVIPIDYVKGWDYMLYVEAGGVPIIEDLSDRLAVIGKRWLTTPLMLAVYLVFTALFITCYILLNRVVGRKEKESIKEG